MEDFKQLRQEYLEYCYDMQKQDDLEQGFNRIVNYRRLRKLTECMEKNFPKGGEALVMDDAMLFDAYRRMPPESRTIDDKKRWFKHAKAFIKNCDKYKNNDRLYRIIDTLPDMNASKKEIFDYSMMALQKMSNQEETYRRAWVMIENNADNLFNDYMLQVNFTDSDDEKLKICGKASKITVFMSPFKRIGAHRDCMGVVFPIYNKSEWRRNEYVHMQSVRFNRIWKSLPSETKNVYKEKSYL